MKKVRFFHSLSAHGALHHLLLGGVPVRAAADGTRQPLVALLVARVAHGVVGVPPGALARARRPGAAVRALAASLKIILTIVIIFFAIAKV